MRKSLQLYRLTWSHARGVYWLPMRSVTADNGEAWLTIFKRDEPTATFCVATKPPRIKPDDQANARHVATL